MHWEIDFCRDDSPSPLFANRLLYFLVSKGAKYNVGEYQGRYSIFGENPKYDIDHFEENDSIGTEGLADIVETYREYDLTKTSLTIHLFYQSENCFHFSVSIVPTESSKTLVSFQTHTNEIPDEETFLTFVHLCKDMFSQFDIAYGSYRTEHMDSLPENLDAFVSQSVQVVNFYSNEVADKIGRDSLLSAPASEVEELENGGVYLLVCPEQLGCYDDLKKVRRYLNQA